MMLQQPLFHKQGNRIVTDVKCSRCELASNPALRTNCMAGNGSATPTYLFVGISPAGEDDDAGVAHSGKASQLLKQLLTEAGISMKDCYFSNVLKCSLRGANPKKSHWAGCQAHLMEELDRLRPKVIVAMGAQTISWLTGQSGVGRLRQKMLPFDGNFAGQVYPLRQPASLFHYEGQERRELHTSLVSDLSYLRKAVTQDNYKRPGDIDLDYKIAQTPEDVDEIFAELEQYRELAFDFETTSLFPKDDDEIVAVGFSFGEGVGRAIPLHARGVTSYWWWEDDYVVELEKRLADLFRRKSFWGHNAIQFDQKWLRSQLGVDSIKICGDTQFASYILDEEPGNHGLEQLACRHTNMTPWKSEFTLEDTLRLCGYLCKDVDATYRLRETLESKQTSLQNWLYKELLIPLAEELFLTEYRGVSINEVGLSDLDAYLKKKTDDARVALRLRPEIRQFSIRLNRAFSPDSPADVRILLRDILRLPCIKKTDGGDYATGADVLQKYLQDHPGLHSLEDILQIRRLGKLHSTYVTGIAEKVYKGRIHTSYKVHGTVTGRPSSSGPNLMNIPRGDTAGKVIDNPDAIKQVFAADPGCVLMQADYSQAELRVLACLSKDARLIDIYARNEDVHTATAAAVYNIPIEEVSKAQRTAAKSVNFGIVYGMTIEGLREKFVQAGSTEEVANFFHDKHKKMFRGVWKYMDDQEAIIRRHRQQVTPFGRTRRYVDIDNRAIRQAYNFPVQSVASDLTELSIIRCGRALRAMHPRVYMALTVYDSIVYNVPIEEFWDVACLVHRIMSTIHFPWMRVPMGVDLEVGYNWGEMKAVDIEQKKILK